jgi:hypothetical protein
MQQIETSPWYPTARLFRQTSPGDWAGVLERVMEKLRGLSKMHSSHCISSRDRHK